ncbi:hypothetical protein PANT_7d00097 [Moesziomyces antarcticus T-34]|uniref:6-phosphogluconolactonase n=1 Tax=Pseudozyma antarctica (strain T-34) TaxID=1151754 RepID=M9MBE7_PSEA3|nr:hypothetical protein PANT_7d00097 [Moesziomyces antarcticus T-34]
MEEVPTSISRRSSEVKRLWSAKLHGRPSRLAKTPTRTERCERVLQFASARRIAGEAYNSQPMLARMSTYRSSSPQARSNLGSRLLVGRTVSKVAHIGTSKALQDPAKMASYTLFAAGYNGTIVPYSVDADKGQLERISHGVQVNSSGTSPSWIAYTSGHHGHAKHSDLHLYSVDETAPGRLFSHTYQAAKGTIAQTGTDLQRTNGTSSGGDGPVSCLVGHGPSKGLLFVANYNSGTAAVLPIDKHDGTLVKEPKHVFQFTRPASAPKLGPVPDRQDHSYAHQVSITPSGRWVYVCDLGADQIHHLRIDEAHNVEFVGSTDVPPGSGPRHITFHRDCSGRTFAYLASELDNTVSAFAHDDATGKLERIQDPILASPPGEPLSGPGILPTNRTTAEIAVVPAGDFVYVSDRGDEEEDHISIFSRDTETGKLSFVEWVKSGGRMPRHFSLSSDMGRDDSARWLAVGHQTDQNIVIFERHPDTGKLTRADVRANIGQVAFTGFAPF